MGKKLSKNRGINILLAIIILVTSLVVPTPSTAAESKYIKTEDFIKQIVQALKIEVNTAVNETYINAAIREGILYTDDFKDYSKYITRTDAAVLINRADEYLHGDTVNKDLLKVIVDKRISDIKKISAGKREAVAKVYAKGIIKGYGNGYYIQNREFRGNKYLAVSTAKSYINLVVNQKNRAKVSPDGQLIRTTKLPKNYKKFDYILACYPNSFYEMKFQFMWHPNDGIKSVYAYPVEMKNEKWIAQFLVSSDSNEIITKSYPFKEMSDKYLNLWTQRVETYLKLIFNVNYKTVGNKLKDGLLEVSARPILGADGFAEGIQEYIDGLKKNKVIIESKVISVEPSTLYYYGGCYYMRAYLKYRITAKDINSDEYKLFPVFLVSLDNLKSGKWREGVFDIKLNTGNNGSALGGELLLSNSTMFNDYFNQPIK
jgi:hypothetical protein